MFGLKKKLSPTNIYAWDIYPQLRWNRVASKWDETEMEYVYLTEPVLQVKRTRNEEWRDIGTDVEIRKVAKK